jgi:hypothetical protein
LIARGHRFRSTKKFLLDLPDESERKRSRVTRVPRPSYADYSGAQRREEFSRCKKFALQNTFPGTTTGTAARIRALALAFDDGGPGTEGSSPCRFAAIPIIPM